MTSLFHRRTRSASAHRPLAPASNSAHVAAAQAFLASNSNLAASASAAAAALRTMSPPPTPVGEVQTKRMQRRASSVSAIGAQRGRGRGRGVGSSGLERSDSTGSMSERTFRSPSPGRRVPAPADTANAPPVPKLPKLPPQVAAAKVQTRSASIDTSAPTRPTPPSVAIAARVGQRGASVQPTTSRRPDAQTAAAILVTNQQRRQAAAQKAENERVSLHQKQTESHVRSSSVNFSRPLSPLQPSPTSPLSRSPVLGNGVSAAEAEQISSSVTQAAQQPVKKKKKKVAPQLVQGSHLSAGHMLGKTVTAASLEPGFPPSPAASLTSTPSTYDSDSDSVTDSTPRRQMRASGALTKQPSVVREDWEGEQMHEQEMTNGRQKPQKEDTPGVGKKPLTAANVSRKLGEPHLAVDSEKPVNKFLALDEPLDRRLGSSSPNRSTRFSDRLASDITAGQKHEPLPRSMSPAKSALKQTSSPTGSVVGTGTGSGVRGSSVAPSEGSDSNGSVDGAGARRKKAVHVSFEPSVETIGDGAGPVETDTPSVLGGAVYADRSITGPYSIGKTGLEEDDEEHIQPRPQLPSFGSIRSKALRTSSAEHASGTDADADSGSHARSGQGLVPPTLRIASGGLASELSSSSVSQTSIESASSDHAIGAIVAQHSQTEAELQSQSHSDQYQLSLTKDEAAALAAPSIERAGYGYISGTETDTSVDERQHPVLDTPLPDSIPMLAVQPPTPGSEGQDLGDRWALDVPGGFPVSTDDLSRITAPPAQSTVAVMAATKQTPNDANAGAIATLAGGAVAEEPSDHDSIYSDAEEAIQELDGDGFASIDAVVESPIIGSPRTTLSSPPASSLADRHAAGTSGQGTAWDAAQERWSGIAKQTRQAQVGASQAAPTPQPPTLSQPPAAKKKKQPPQTQSQPQQQLQQQQVKPKKKKPASATAAAVAAASNSASSAAAAAAAQPSVSLRSPSKRATIEPRPNEQQPATRSSVRPQSTAARLTPSGVSLVSAESKARPHSMYDSGSTPPSQQRGALQKKNTAYNASPSVTLSRSGTTRKTVAPLSNDSDSESSFKKSRKRNASAGSASGMYTMRRSMRADGPPTRRGVARSLSPPSRRAFSPQGDQRPFRSSMRASGDSSLQPKRSSSLFSTSHRPMSGAARTPALSLATARPSQRYNDSSDDEDDDRRAPLRPVRGIPRRNNDQGDDSTDLDDSSDEEPKHKSLHITAAASAASSPHSRHLPATKKKGIMSIFRSKHKGEDYDDDEDDEHYANEDGDELSNLGFASAADRDALVAQTMARLEASKQGPGQGGRSGKATDSPLPPVLEQDSQPNSPTRPGRLHRRVSSPPVQDAPNLWPLPPKNGGASSGDQQYRPNTSDGVHHGKGSLLDRVSSNDTAPSVAGQGGKKKRFPMLRKAFGLRD